MLKNLSILQKHQKEPLNSDFAENLISKLQLENKESLNLINQKIQKIFNEELDSLKEVNEAAKSIFINDNDFEFRKDLHHQDIKIFNKVMAKVVTGIESNKPAILGPNLSKIKSKKFAFKFQTMRSQLVGVGICKNFGSSYRYFICFF